MSEKKGTEIRREEIAMAVLSLVAHQGVIERGGDPIYRHFSNKAEILKAVVDGYCKFWV
jgi:hypothetical protein